MEHSQIIPTARIAKFDNIKAFLILIVVLGHGITPFLDSHLAKATTLWLYTYHMPLFVFMGGLFAKRSVNAATFNTARIAAYIVLGFLIKLMIHVTLLLCGGESSFSWLDEKGVAWYIFAMAAHLVITHLVRKLPSKLVLCTGVTLAMGAGYFSFIDDTLVLSRIIVFFPFFYLGYMTDREKLLQIICNKGVRIMSLVFLIIFSSAIYLLTHRLYNLRFLFTGNNPYFEFGSDWYPYGALLRLGGYIMSCVAGFCFMSIMPSKKIPVFTSFGKNSLSIYVFHRPVQYALNNLFFAAFASSLEPFVMLGSVLLISVIICIGFSQKLFSYILRPFTDTKGFLKSVRITKNK